jgi:hypothetical protein
MTRDINLFCMGVELGPLTTEEHRLKSLQNKSTWKKLGKKMQRRERPITRRISTYSSPSHDARNVREKEKKTEII